MKRRCFSFFGFLYAGTWRIVGLAALLGVFAGQTVLAAPGDTFEPRVETQATLAKKARKTAEVLAARAVAALRQPSEARCRKAVSLYSEATELVTPYNTKLAAAYQQQRIGALYELGTRYHDNAALEEVVGYYQQAIAGLDPELQTARWAELQVKLGDALSALGARETGTVRLAQAVEAFREALRVYRPALTPREWANTQNNLGDALLYLGERESDDVNLELSLKAYQEALQGLPRDSFDWAGTQIRIGDVQQMLGERQHNAELVSHAINTYQSALYVLQAGGADIEYCRDVARKLDDAQSLRAALR